MNCRLVPTPIYVIAHLIYKPRHIIVRWWLVFYALNPHRAISEFASASINLIDRQPLKFPQKAWSKPGFPAFPFLCIMQDCEELDSAVPGFELEFFLSSAV
jgi:hypothetical protein